MYVRVTQAGDSCFKVGEVIELETFITWTRSILMNGGEMPIAVLVDVN